ncbi:MAG: hypothetical protein V4555_03395 [Acidobacteriota bacterium]
MMTIATRKLRKSGLTTVAAYFVIFGASFYANYRLQPTGALLWVLATLPVVPILGVIVLFGRYLRDERDEYKRDLTMRCLLWGTAGCVAVTMLESYLRIYGWKGEFPPFTAFWAFFVFMMAAKLTYNAQNKVPTDE